MARGANQAEPHGRGETVNGPSGWWLRWFNLWTGEVGTSGPYINAIEAQEAWIKHTALGWRFERYEVFWLGRT